MKMKKYKISKNFYNSKNMNKLKKYNTTFKKDEKKMRK